VDHAADRIGPVQTTLRTPKDFDLRNILGQKLCEIEARIRTAGIAYVDAVGDDLGMIQICAAHENGGLPTGTTRLHDVESGDISQDIRQRALLFELNVFASDDGYAAGDLRFGCWNLGGRNDDRLGCDIRGERVKGNQ